MEITTPPPPSTQTDAAALIVRMPDSTHYKGLRRWIDRTEVDEMILREETNRGRKRAVRTVLYTSDPREVAIKDGMDLYFVGHASAFGFLGEQRIDEDDLKDWIKARIAGEPPVRLNKIKLVTCNAGRPSETNNFDDEFMFASRLAKALAGIATGKVIGFSGYLLSTPSCKAVYQKEPRNADLSAKAVQTRLSQREQTLRDKMSACFADIVMPTDGQLSQTGVQWAVTVICKDADRFQAVVDKLKRKHDILAALNGDKCGVCWPVGKKEDLETMIRGMKERNQRIQSPHKGHAAGLFAEWEKEIASMALEEWTWRKQQIALAYEKETDTRVYERKTSGVKMANRVEVTIPGS